MAMTYYIVNNTWSITRLMNFFYSFDFNLKYNTYVHFLRFKFVLQNSRFKGRFVYCKLKNSLFSVVSISQFSDDCRETICCW